MCPSFSDWLKVRLGYPIMGYPLARSGWGRVPHDGVPPAMSGQGVGTPWQGYPQPGMGYPPPRRGQRSICLLCSHRRTFLFLKFLEDRSPFRGVTDTPVLDFWWRLALDFKAKVDSLRSFSLEWFSDPLSIAHCEFRPSQCPTDFWQDTWTLSGPKFTVFYARTRHCEF